MIFYTFVLKQCVSKQSKISGQVGHLVPRFRLAVLHLIFAIDFANPIEFANMLFAIVLLFCVLAHIKFVHVQVKLYKDCINKTLQCICGGRHIVAILNRNRPPASSRSRTSDSSGLTSRKAASLLIYRFSLKRHSV
jgi:hypothetical protein